ncbi:unnamed protein product, partial [Ectocarpus sp. 12 AP-2014]
QDEGAPSSTEQGGGGVPEEDVSSEDKKSGDGDSGGSGDKPQADVADPAAAEGALTAGRRAAAEKPYTVLFHGRRLGIQLREMHKIPIVGGLQGYDPDGTQDSRGEDGEDDGGSEEEIDGLPVEVSPEPSAFDE